MLKVLQWCLPQYMSWQVPQMQHCCLQRLHRLGVQWG